MTGIKPLWDAAWDEIRLAYYRWALAEIRPCHPDVPKIVIAIHSLEAKQ